MWAASTSADQPRTTTAVHISTPRVRHERRYTRRTAQPHHQVVIVPPNRGNSTPGQPLLPSSPAGPAASVPVRQRASAPSLEELIVEGKWAMLDLNGGDLDGERLCHRSCAGGGETGPLPRKGEALARMEGTGMDG